MPQCTDLELNWPMCSWADPAAAGEDTTHCIQIYYAATADAEPVLQESIFGFTGTSRSILGNVVNNCGAGYYSFRVRAIPDDISQYRVGEWSEMSEAFYYDPATFAYDESWILQHAGKHPSGDPDMKLTYTDVPIVLKNDFTVPSDRTLDIGSGGSITVPAGKTLTVNCDQVSIYNGGKLIVEEGGTLIVNSFIVMYEQNGFIDVRGDIIFNNDNRIINIMGNGIVGGQVTGVPMENQTLLIHLSSDSSYWEEGFTAFESSTYGYTELYVWADITLPRSMTTPKNSAIIIRENAALTIPAGEVLDLHGALWVSAWGTLQNNGTIQVYGGLGVDPDGAVYNNGTIHMMESNVENGENRLSVYEGGYFRNSGTVTVQPWATVYAEGTWEGNYPVNNGGDVHGSALSMTQKEFEAEVAAAKKAGTEYILQKSVEITKSMTLDYQVIIHKNATVTVHKGATLTVNKGIGLQNGADLLINEGAKLKNNSYVTSYATSEAFGTLGVNGTYVHGKNATVYIMQGYGTPAFYGIDEQYLTARFGPADEETLLEALELEGYGEIEVWTDSLELNTDITIPANMRLIINPTWSDLQNGTRNDWVYINSNVTVYGALLPNAYYNGTPCNLQINGNIEVMPGGNMYTCGNVRNYGSVRIRTGAYYEFTDYYGAVWEGNPPIIDMTEKDLRNKIKNGETWINLSNPITLTDDLTLPEGVSLNICDDGSLTVPKGVTLTMNGRNYIRGNGKLTVEAGGTFQLNNYLHIYDNAVIDVQGTAKFGQYWAYVCRKYDSGWDNVTVSGIPLEQQAVNVFFRDTNSDAWETSADIVEDNIYALTFMMVVGGEITLPRDMTLPEKTILHVDDRNTTLIIPEGVTLNNNGSIYVWAANKLINYGTINNYCYIPVYGKLYNYGEINGYAATPDSRFTNQWSHIGVYENGYVNNQGTVNIYPSAELFMIATWEGNDPNDLGGSVTMGRYQGNSDGAYLSAGKSLTLSVWDCVEGKALASKAVTWSLPEEYAAYATITAKGKLTARSVAEAVTIEAIATILDTGEEIVTTVHLFPSVTQLEILDGDTVVNGKTVTVDVSEEERSFALNLYPLDLDTEELKNGWCSWSISDKKEAYAEYTIENGILTVSNPTGKTGTVTVKVSYDVGTKKTVSFKLNFGSFAKSVEILNTETELVSGSKLQLNAVVRPLYVTKSGVTWSLKNAADKSYVTLSSSGKLTAKTVYGEKNVTVVATSKDGQASAEYTVTILPKDQNMLILKYNGENVTKSTVNVDLNTTESVTLTAHAFGVDEKETVTWKSSGKSVVIGNDGVVTILGKGSATITATASDGRKATVTLKMAQLASDVIVNGDGEVASGQSIKLTADVKKAASSKVTWSITEGAEYAKINSSGKLTAAKDITSAKTVTVRATANDGSGVYGEKTVTIRPAAQSVQIYIEKDGATLFSARSTNWWILSNTTLEWDMGAETTLSLSYRVYPYYGEGDDRNAIQNVTWKSSGKNIADFLRDGDGNLILDKNGNVQLICYKPGTTTITATAADGSGKKVTFKLKVK